MNLTKNYGEILLTIDKLREVFNLDKAYLAIKNTNYKSIRNVKSIIGIYPNIEIVLLPDKYLIKEKNNLCAYLNKEEETTLVINTKDVYNIYEALNGKYISEVLITISGDAIKKSLIINTKIGVSLKELMAKFIELTTDDYDIYLNGYLRGRKISSNEDIIITHKTECIVINKRSDNEVSECINCGACMRICPKNINVLKCFLEGKSHKRCINCGLCNFICPANLALKEVLIGDIDEKENN